MKFLSDNWFISASTENNDELCESVINPKSGVKYFFLPAMSEWNNTMEALIV